jgi:hypothetical protein
VIRPEVRLSRGEREVLHRAVTLELGAMQAVLLALEHIDFQVARDLACDFDALITLLDDLGDADEARGSYAVTLENDRLAEVLRRLMGSAEESLRDRAGPEVSDEDLDCWVTCRRLLAWLDMHSRLVAV